MLPLVYMPEQIRLGLRGVLTDIDDTLSTAGRISGAAYTALERLQDAGLRVIPITGRPAGWCDHIARMWPVDAVVGENGAFYMRYDHERRKLATRRVQSREDPELQSRLVSIAHSILREVPGAAIASDQPYRTNDLAIDYCEDVARLPTEAVDRIVALMQAEGMTAKVSSIHVNGWFGQYDKLGMTRTLLAECFATDLDERRDEFVFIGDSPNDAPMFAFFPASVGVANVRDYGERLPKTPAYVTEACSGSGFVELVDFILAGR